MLFLGTASSNPNSRFFPTPRFSELAKSLACRARGKKRGHQWMLDDSQEASYDDISVFVIPLHNRVEDC